MLLLRYLLFIRLILIKSIYKHFPPSNRAYFLKNKGTPQNPGTLIQGPPSQSCHHGIWGRLLHNQVGISSWKRSVSGQENPPCRPRRSCVLAETSRVGLGREGGGCWGLPGRAGHPDRGALRQGCAGLGSGLPGHL